MPINSEHRLLTQTWHKLIAANQNELAQNLSDLDLSALNSWPEDSFESFQEILKLLEEVRAKPDDNALIHDNVVDIFWQLDHIKNHIDDAAKGFTDLMRLLAEKSESKR